MVGKSTFGRSLTGKARYPATPNRTIPIMRSAVMTGRMMKISVRFILTLRPSSLTVAELLSMLNPSRVRQRHGLLNGGGTRALTDTADFCDTRVSEGGPL